MGTFKNSKKYKYIVATTDYITKLMNAKAMKENMTKKIADFLYKVIITSFGCSLELVNYQDLHFTG